MGARSRPDYSDGELKPGTKNGPLRIVPLRKIVFHALEEQVSRTRSDLVFPPARGRYISYGNFGKEYCDPALRAAGLDHRGPYAMRHTFCTWSIAAGVELWYVARVMGTSVQYIERTYAHFLRRTPDRIRRELDSYDEDEGFA